MPHSDWIRACRYDADRVHLRLYFPTRAFVRISGVPIYRQRKRRGSVEGTYSSLAFGDGYSASGSDADPRHYTGLDNDASSGTIHAMFRQYSPQSGRWMSPAPYAGSYDSRDPQSLNRYAYVLNNPMSYIDPYGLSWECTRADSFTITDTGQSYGAGTPFCKYSGGGDGGTGAKIPFAPDDEGNGEGGGSGAPSNAENPPPCQAKILNATNNKFGTNDTDANVNSTFNYSTGAGSGYTPQAGGVDMRSASPLFKTVPVGVYLSPSDPSGNSVSSVSVDLTVKNVGVTAYMNLGTRTPNLSDPQNCP